MSTLREIDSSSPLNWTKLDRFDNFPYIKQHAVWCSQNMRKNSLQDHVTLKLKEYWKIEIKSISNLSSDRTSLETTNRQWRRQLGAEY